MKELVSFENNFVSVDGQEHDAIASVSIDGYPADGETGSVVCEVFITKKGDIVVSWHDNGYLLNEDVKGLVNESITILRGIYQEEV